MFLFKKIFSLNKSIPEELSWRRSGIIHWRRIRIYPFLIRTKYEFVYIKELKMTDEILTELEVELKWIF